ncbi:MAG TPA: hemerythrin domain-containing protein [Rhizomicrobium sp.]|nr:hemerythrin domain-containing protein [Rhizomicrobium sp.]
MTVNSRRQLVTAGTLAIVGAAALPAAPARSKEEKEVGAVEDLMREHGVLRRALLVYFESVPKLRSAPAALDAGALHRAAKLFRDFGEDYHERKLEEAHIFPRIKSAGGPAASYVDILLDQHRRGREITQYILSVTASGRVATASAEPLARAFESFVPMYQNHAAREDTIVFPAWKDALSAKELDELGDQFEDIERAQFGGDGFEKSVHEIGAIEQALGFADLAQFTAPPPPH